MAEIKLLGRVEAVMPSSSNSEPSDPEEEYGQHMGPEQINILDSYLKSQNEQMHHGTYNIS